MAAKPVISKDFTIEDIHKIREYNYEVTKGMTLQEKLAYYNADNDEEQENIVRDELAEG